MVALDIVFLTWCAFGTTFLCPLPVADSYVIFRSCPLLLRVDVGVLCVRAGTLLLIRSGGVERSKRRSGLFLLFLFASLQVSISSVSLLSGLPSDTRSAWLTY